MATDMWTAYREELEKILKEYNIKYDTLKGYLTVLQEAETIGDVDVLMKIIELFGSEEFKSIWENALKKGYSTDNLLRVLEEVFDTVASVGDIISAFSERIGVRPDTAIATDIVKNIVEELRTAIQIYGKDIVADILENADIDHAVVNTIRSLKIKYGMVRSRLAKLEEEVKALRKIRREYEELVRRIKEKEGLAVYTVPKKPGEEKEEKPSQKTVEEKKKRRAEEVRRKRVERLYSLLTTLGLKKKDVDELIKDYGYNAVLRATTIAYLFEKDIAQLEYEKKLDFFRRLIEASLTVRNMSELENIARDLLQLEKKPLKAPAPAPAPAKAPAKPGKPGATKTKLPAMPVKVTLSKEQLLKLVHESLKKLPEEYRNIITRLPRGPLMDMPVTLYQVVLTEPLYAYLVGRYPALGEALQALRSYPNILLRYIWYPISDLFGEIVFKYSRRMNQWVYDVKVFSIAELLKKLAKIVKELSSTSFGEELEKKIYKKYIEPVIKAQRSALGLAPKGYAGLVATIMLLQRIGITEGTSVETAKKLYKKAFGKEMPEAMIKVLKEIGYLR